MATLLLIIIYLAFISLGLPDSLLGVAWPLMQKDIHAPFDAAGWIQMTIFTGTVISSLLSGTVTKRFGVGGVTFVSTLLTAGALLGFSVAPSLIWYILLAVPLGLGTGSVDAALNNYVANHYQAKHMNWLHCFWGVGASIGPMIMSILIAGKNSFREGYLAVASLQFLLVLILFVSLPLWNKVGGNKTVQNATQNETKSAGERSGINHLQIRGVKWALLVFFFYSGIETTVGLWGSSFLVNIKDIPVHQAAQWVSFYFGGITIGRFVSGFLTMRWSNKTLIRAGQMTILIGALFILIPLPHIFVLMGFVLIGLGLAPIYPGMIHETPVRFGQENSQYIIGYQMAVAFTGSTIVPPLLGFVASRTTIGILSLHVLLFGIAMYLSAEKLNSLLKKKTVKSHVS